MKKNKIIIFRIIISFIILFSSIILEDNIKNILLFIGYLIIGYDVLLMAIRNIFKGNFLDENFLMTIATIGAIAIKELPEAMAVMLFYQIGELFQNMAVEKSRKSISELMEIRPDYANLLINDEAKKVSPDEVQIGDIILVKPGEKVPIDGIVIDGNSLVDTKSITGESTPKNIKINDEIISGCINLNGLLKIKVTKIFKDSTVSKILELVENASNKKSKSEKFITKFSRVYTPVVVILAILITLIPTIIFGFNTFSNWFSRSLVFLVVSCPCALVISVPLGFFAGIGGASKKGILVKGSSYIESLSKVRNIVFDKTGTLTEGIFEVQKVLPDNIKAFDLIKYSAYAENYSNHPIAISIKRFYGTEIDEGKISSVEEISGKGIRATVFGKEVLIGNAKLLEDKNIEFKEVKEIGSLVYVAINKTYAGCIIISDKVKKDAKATINSLEKDYKIETVILTGDAEKNAKQIADSIGISKCYSELLPTDKVEIFEKIVSKKEENTKVAFVGDGVNDSPVLARADIGIAMGDIGSDAAIEAADLVIMNGEVKSVLDAIKISKSTIKIVKQNIIFAITVKILILIISALGLGNMWLAVFADVGVSVICILNSMRNLKIKNL
ncbi:MAG: cadmium-translocating P-type ATPase [Clostridia bacterium]|nr:cadmium-translocating P-type ATPase [Clostridia bacterium]